MIILNNEIQTPLYVQIYEQLKVKIVSKELLAGSKISSIQTLASSLGVSKNTVLLAYQQLESEGYIYTKPRSGFFVEKLYHEPLPQLNSINTTLDSSQRKKEEFPLEESKLLNKDVSPHCKYDFQYGDLDKEVFPIKIWKNLSNEFLSSSNNDFWGIYSEAKGETGLRNEIMNYLRNSRGVSCNPEQIIICSGTQQSLTIICQLLRTFSTSVAFEEPGYDGARDIFVNSGFHVTPVPINEKGVDLETLAKLNAKILYTTPSHQFPTGKIIPIQQRMQLLDWAISTNSIIIEDDYDSELRYVGKPIPSLQSIDTDNRVIYVGTFSKSLSPALRISYMVLPQPILEMYLSLFNKYVSHTPWLEQKILEKFIKDSHWDRHLRRVCVAYKKKHDLLISSINKSMGEKVKIHGKNAGLHILLEVNNGLTEKKLINQALEKKVAVYPVSQYWMDVNKYPNNMVLLGYSGISKELIPKGIELLSEAWFN